jgi:hypothetical protein
VRFWRRRKRVAVTVHGDAMSLAARAGHKVPEEFVSRREMRAKRDFMSERGWG